LLIAKINAKIHRVLVVALKKKNYVFRNAKTFAALRMSNALLPSFHGYN
jgi:hypothetical protein